MKLPLAFRIVIDDQLVAKLTDVTKRGVLGGAYVSGERLFVTTQGQFISVDGNETATIFTEVTRLFTHRTFIKSLQEEPTVLPFLIVKPGFSQALNSKQLIAANLTEWTIDGFGMAGWEQVDTSANSSAFSLCCIELAAPSPVVSLAVHFPNSESPDLLPGTVELVSNYSNFPNKYIGLAPLEALRKKKVAVVGVGSIGSALAVSLAASGVGVMYLLDDDGLSLNNLHRHSCGINHIGRYKVDALKDLIQDYNLPTEVVPLRNNIVSEPEPLWRLMPEVDLVIGATDSIPSRRLLNYQCVRSNRTLILGCAFENARIGEIIRIRPGFSACYECTRTYLFSVGAMSNAEALDSLENEPYRIRDVEREDSVETGTRVDVSLIAHLQARVAITTLLQTPIDKHDSATQALETDIPYDYLSWGVAPTSGFEAPFNFVFPFSVTWTEIPQDSDCPVCGGAKRVTKIETELAYSKIIEQLKNTSFSSDS